MRLTHLQVFTDESSRCGGDYFDLLEEDIEDILHPSFKIPLAIGEIVL